MAIANHERRNHRHAGRHRDASHPIAGARLHSEKIDEDPVAHVEVERDRDLLFLAQVFHHREAGLFTLDDLRAEAGPHPADFAIY